MKSERCVNENRSKEQNNLQKQSAKAKIKPDATCWDSGGDGKKTERAPAVGRWAMVRRKGTEKAPLSCFVYRGITEGTFLW